MKGLPQAVCVLLVGGLFWVVAADNCTVSYYDTIYQSSYLNCTDLTVAGRFYVYADSSVVICVSGAVHVASSGVIEFRGEARHLLSADTVRLESGSRLLFERLNLTATTSLSIAGTLTGTGTVSTPQIGTPDRCPESYCGGYGGAHGGRGGLGQPCSAVSKDPYDSSAYPLMVGSPGGAGYISNSSASNAGKGGGSIFIWTEAFILDNYGVLVSHGSAGGCTYAASGGGGSGGSILVFCFSAVVNYATTISVAGGDGQHCSYQGGGGGGGRIAFYQEENDGSPYPVDLFAGGGTGYNDLVGEQGTKVANTRIYAPTPSCPGRGSSTSSSSSTAPPPSSSAPPPSSSTTTTTTSAGATTSTTSQTTTGQGVTGGSAGASTTTPSGSTTSNLDGAQSSGGTTSTTATSTSLDSTTSSTDSSTDTTAAAIVASGSGSGKSGGGNSMVAILAAVLAALVVLILVLLFVYMRRRRSSSTNNRADSTATGDEQTLKFGLGGSTLRAVQVRDLLDAKSTELLGSGLTADVYRVKFNKEMVAMKRFKDEDATSLAEFHAEISVLGRFGQQQHPHIVNLRFICSEPTLRVIVMDLADGGSLSSYVNGGKALTSAVRRQLFADIASGMLFLHQHGIVHLDLKPGNVLLTSTHSPKIADFGTSTVSETDTEVDVRSFAGTPQYAAPERLTTQRYRYRPTDVYSYGATMWALMSKSIPAAGEELSTITSFRSTQLASECFPKQWEGEDDVFELIQACCNPVATSRPSFEAIFVKLGTTVNPIFGQ